MTLTALEIISGIIGIIVLRVAAGSWKELFNNDDDEDEDD